MVEVAFANTAAVVDAGKSARWMRPSVASAGGFAAGRQTTLRQRVRCAGTGLHTGRRVELALVPAPAGTGIRFHRTDVADDRAWISARWDQVRDTTLCTVISNSHDVSVSTVEHLMAALAAAGIDNATVELDASEPPAMDGSAEPFLSLIESAGISRYTKPRRQLRILKAVKVEEDGKSAMLRPARQAEIDVEVLFDNPMIGRQRIKLDLTGPRFQSDLARARTFGFAEEVAYMRSKGLALGGSLANAIVLDGEKILNPEGLRYADEFVRHKALDAVGDLFLAGGPFIGRYVGRQAGHKLNNMLLRALFADAANYTWTESVGGEHAAPSAAGAQQGLQR